MRQSAAATHPFDYIHYNPVKHGLAGSPGEWPFSTFRRWVAQGVYPRSGGELIRRISAGWTRPRWNDYSLFVVRRRYALTHHYALFAFMMMTQQLPRYDISRSYHWNYQNAPDPVELDVPPWPGLWDFCGLPVASPLGIAAGPLLNGRWLLYYASLGYSVLTYKTVRSESRECYPLPNLVPVEVPQLAQPGRQISSAAEMLGSWAISFGMPSAPPDVWRADLEVTRKRMPPGTVLSVSVVGTEAPGGSLDDLANDYARCARWAVESGAQVIEANFSCPNVCSADGQLDRDPRSATVVAKRLREAIGDTPLLLKIGFIANDELATRLIKGVSPYVTGLSMTNCIAAQVKGPDGQALFEGQPRGIGGFAIRDASVSQIRRFRRIAGDLGEALVLVGVGGASTSVDVQNYLSAGVNAVHVATAAMEEPRTALQIAEEWCSSQRER